MTLPINHIRVGNFIWYGGNTSTFGWDCPAVIIEVNEAEQWFRVKSLDDFRDQHQQYSFAVNQHSPASRKSMRAISPEEARPHIDALAIEYRNRVDSVEDKVAKVRAQGAEDQAILNEIIAFIGENA